jgi:hypothetical protein
MGRIMGFADLFGFGKKKKKTPFKIPDEVSTVRIRIEDQNRENYPDLARYQELVKSVKAVFAHLDAIIAQADHAEEAARVREDIKNKMLRLTEKVNKNKEAAKKEGNADYVASNMEYLERKSMRNKAKTLFTECLEAIGSIMECSKEGRLKNGTTMASATAELMKAMSALHRDYFNKQGDDKEIKSMREELLKKIHDLNDFFEKNRESLKEKRLDATAQACLLDIARATETLSEK